MFHKSEQKVFNTQHILNFNGWLQNKMYDVLQIQCKSKLTHSVSLRICLVLLVALSVVIRLITGSFGS